MDLNSEEEIDSILALIDELKSEDNSTKLHAINSIHEIARAIGAERTREELVPYINELLEDDNEEVLMALAVKLSELTGFVGGASHISCLIPPLHNLATNEDASVRSKAIESINDISCKLPMSLVPDVLLPVIQALSNSDWFSAKISACSLIHIPFPKFSPDHQSQLVSTFVKLVKDDTPMVRRSAAENLGHMIQLSKSRELLDLIPGLAKDDHESVRQKCLESIILIFPDNRGLQDTLKQYQKDKSWRTRYAFLEHIQEILEPLESAEDFLPEMVALLSDNEPEVRSIALEKLAFVVEKVSDPAAQAQVVPMLANLAKDTSPYVRISLMMNICKLSKFFGREAAEKSLLPIITLLTKDDNFEVRLSFAEHIAEFNLTLGPEKVVQMIVPILLSMMSDQQWRVRLKVVESIPQFADLLGESLFSEHISGHLLKWVEDSVYSVRERALEAFKELATLFGNSWVSSRLITFVSILSGNSIFTKRMTAIRSVYKLAYVLGPQESIKILKKLSSDKVPNIRFSVAKCLCDLKEVFNNKQAVKEVLEPLRNDEDFDVRHFAEMAYSAY